MNRKSLLPFRGFVLFYFLILSVNKMVLGSDTEKELILCGEKAQVEPQWHHITVFGGPVCCGNEKYEVGTESDFVKYFKDCNVEPKDQTMSLEDCFWTFYQCFVSKSIGSNALTQTSYIEMMAKNLPDSKRSAIQSLVKDKKDTPMESTGNSELQSIKTYFSNYFDAEYKVCTESWSLPESSKNVLKKNWAPAISCLNGIHPRISGVPISYTDSRKCWDSFENKIMYPIQINSSYPFEAVGFVTCRLILGGFITEQDFNSLDVNYETLFLKIIPTFFSKALKQSLMDATLNRARVKYQSGMSAGIGEIAKEIMKSKQEILGDVMNTDKANFYLNSFTIFEFVSAFYNEVGEICMGPEYATKTE